MKHIIAIKTLSWIVLGFTLSILVSYIYYGSFALTGFLGLLTLTANTAYYLHEKAWNKINKRNERGLEKPSEISI